MMLLAHIDAGIINTWGFAYVGGIIGLFSVSLLYVKAKIVERSNGAGETTKRSSLSVLGPGVIAIGGVCGVSLGLGTAGVLERAVGDDVDVSSVVLRLCDPADEPIVEDQDLHEDIEHAVDDLDAVAARAVHSELHAEGPTTNPDSLVDRLVMELTTSDGDRIDSCDAALGKRDSVDN